MPGRLYAKLCHAFRVFLMVSVVIIVMYRTDLYHIFRIGRHVDADVAMVAMI